MAAYDCAMSTRDARPDGPPAPAAPGALREQPGERVGHYELSSVLGHGGFGTVWRARRLEPFEQWVALKIVKPGMDSEAVLARFEQERQALARMDHAGIARAIDGGLTPRGRPYFVMELVDGAPIVEHCDRNRLGLAERVRLLAQACDAVQHAHQRGIIHRDLKPSNILVRRREDGSDEVKVIDFGIAKALAADGAAADAGVTEFGEVMGTPAYMSPEQADPDGAAIDTRTDVWGLGAVLHELVTGVPPVGGDGPDGTRATRADTMRALRAGAIPRIATRAATVTEASAAARGTDVARLRAATRGELGWIPARALRPVPAERYESAAELARDLRRWLAGEPLAAGPDRAAYRLRAYARTHRAQVAAAAAAAASLVAATGVSAWFAVHESRARAQADVRALETRRVADLQAEVLSRIDPVTVGAGIVQDMLNRHRDALRAAEPDADRRKAILASTFEEVRRVNRADLGREVVDRWLVTPAEESIESRLGDVPIAAAAMRHEMAKRRWMLEQLDRAEALAAQALEERTRLLGPDAPETLETEHLLGMIAWSRKDLDVALARLRRAWEGRRAALGAASEPAAESARAYGEALSGAGREAEAIAPLEAALTTMRSLHGMDSAQAAIAEGRLGWAMAKCGRTEEGIRLLRSAVEGVTAALGADAPGAIYNQGLLGSALALAGEMAAATATLDDAVARAARVLGTNDAVTRHFRAEREAIAARAAGGAP